MAISYVSGSSAVLATQASTTLTLTLPSGIQQNDLILIYAANGEDSPQPSVSTPPSGYTQRGSGVFLDYGAGGITGTLWWKFAGSSESSPSITWNTGDSNGGGLFAVIVVYRGVDTTSPFDLASVSEGTSSSSSTFTPPSVTTQTNGAYVVSFIQTADNNANDLLSGSEQGFTRRLTGTNFQTTTGSDAGFGVADKEITTAGSVTMPTWSQTTLGPDAWGYQTIGLTPYVTPVDDTAPAGNAASAATANAATPAVADAPLLAAAGGVNLWRGNACFDVDVSGWDGNTSATISWDGAEGRSSLGSMKVVSTEGDVAAARVMQTLATNNVVDLAASAVTYSFWIKTTTATSVTVAYQGGYGTSVIVVTGGHAVTAGQWSRVDYTYNRPDLGLNGVRFGLRTATADTYWVDDFMVEYKDAEPASDFVRPGAALPPTTHVQVSAGVASITSTAYQPTEIITGGEPTNAQATLAAATAAANPSTIGVKASAGVAAASGAAQNAAGKINSPVGVAAGTGTAYQATPAEVTNAGVAAATGAAQGAVVKVGAAPAASTLTGTANDATVSTGTAETTADAGVAAATATAYNVGGVALAYAESPTANALRAA